MSIWMEQLLKHCRKPAGWLGRLVARRMNKSHSPLTEWGLSKISIENDAVILDVGCGGGETVRKLSLMAPQGKIYGIDYSEDSVRVSKQTNRQAIRSGRVEIKQASVSDIPYPADTFDLVTAVETYYFWPHLLEDLREVLRVLKPAGQVLIACEVYKGGKFEERNRQWVEVGKMAYHSMAEFEDLLLSAGYIDVRVIEDYHRGWLCAAGEKPMSQK